MSTARDIPPTGARAYICAQSMQHNIALVRNMCGASNVIGIIKANAYGHGLERVAQIIAPSVNALGVARMEEAIRIRDAGLNKIPILVMSPMKSIECFSECATHNLDIVLQDQSELDILEQLPRNSQIRVWLKMNCGLHRLGCDPKNYASMLKRTLAAQQVNAVIAMTHFSCSSDADSTITLKELDLFESISHAGTQGASGANSGAICRFPQTHLDWVRPGLLLYGANPAPELLTELQLRPVMRFCAPIIAIRQVPKGGRVGYGGWWRASRSSKIAIVSAGYADGYPCCDADASVEAFIHGRRVPLVGQVSMDMLAIDISDVPEASMTDLVELWGENISVNEVSARSKRRLYTLLTGISERVPRVYINT